MKMMYHAIYPCLFLSDWACAISENLNLVMLSIIPGTDFIFQWGHLGDIAGPDCKIQDDSTDILMCNLYSFYLKHT